jgi:spore coat polysaccharide biosynthesis predicted glycosyltransferase SpsG
MAQLMAESDLAIGAAGSTSWERCSQGLPSIISVVADNQNLIADALETAGAARTFVTDDAMPALRTVIAELADDPRELSKMSRCAANVSDGGGSIRVATAVDALN